jgi:hypothetical protein
MSSLNGRLIENDVLRRRDGAPRSRLEKRIQERDLLLPGVKPVLGLRESVQLLGMWLLDSMANGDPGGNRTPNPQFRRLMLYPVELRGRVVHNILTEAISEHVLTFCSVGLPLLDQCQACRSMLCRGVHVKSFPNSDPAPPHPLHRDRWARGDERPNFWGTPEPPLRTSQQTSVRMPGFDVRFLGLWVGAAQSLH